MAIANLHPRPVPSPMASLRHLRRGRCCVRFNELDRRRVPGPVSTARCHVVRRRRSPRRPLWRWSCRRSPLRAPSRPRPSRNLVIWRDFSRLIFCPDRAVHAAFSSFRFLRSSLQGGPRLHDQLALWNPWSGRRRCCVFSAHDSLRSPLPEDQEPPTFPKNSPCAR